MLFLEGKHEEVLADLRHQMDEAAENLEFERAAAMRDRVQRRGAGAGEAEDHQHDWARRPGCRRAGRPSDDETCAQVFFFRGGKLVGREYFMLQGTRDTPPAEIIVVVPAAVLRHRAAYSRRAGAGRRAGGRRGAAAWLRQKRGGAVTLTVPQRGEKLRLVEMVAQNAREVLEQQRIKWLSDSRRRRWRSTSCARR